MNNPITIKQIINKSIDIVWKSYTDPAHIVHWNQASTDWHTPYATNNLKIGGRFNYRMEAKDGSFGFNFEGTYVDLVSRKSIHYVLDDNRHVSITFKPENNQTHVTIVFEAEAENTRELQEFGWQEILNSFKRYTELITS